MPGLVLSLVCLSVHAQSTVPTPEIYTCIDAKGRKLTSDRPITDCSDREQKILNPSGTVKARVGPTLTARERLQLDAKNKTEQEERASKEEDRRRDRALLVRYPSPALHHKERAEALAQINLVKQAATSRVAELQAERTKLTDEMGFYKKDPSKAPQKLRQQLEEMSQTLAAQERFLAEQDVELKRVNGRFDEELSRLTPLWRMAGTVTLPAPTP